MATLRKIRFARTDLETNDWSALKLKASHGEPIYIKRNGHHYLTIGTNPDAAMTIADLHKLKYLPNNVVDNMGSWNNDSFDSGRVSDIRQLADDGTTNSDVPLDFFPRTIDNAVVVKKDSSGTSYANTRTLSEKLYRIDQLLGDVNDAAGTIGDKNGHHETRVDTIEQTIGVNGYTGTGSKYINSTLSSANANYYLLGVPSSGTQVYNARPATRTHSSAGVYWNGATGSLYGASWNNDYAESRYSFWSLPAGTCVVDDGYGGLQESTDYLMPCGHIVSDTYGMCIGNDDEKYLPIALKGKVLAFCETPKNKLNIGDCVCTAPGGKVRKMTRREIRRYPDRIVGVVIELPIEEEWHDRLINGRIWIDVK